MSTKDFNLKRRTFINSKFKQIPSNDYLNLNLNVNSPCAVVRQKSNGFDNRKSTVCHTISSTEKKENKILRKKELTGSQKINAFGMDKEIDTKTRNKEDSSANKKNSTLSLHITAYENSINHDDSFDAKNDTVTKVKKACLIEKWENHIIQNTFEFARQQENEEPQIPQVSQFRASQRLLNPNSSGGKGGRPKGSLAKKTATKDARRQSVSQRYAPSVLETMNDQQLFHYNLAIKKNEKTEGELAEEKLRRQEMEKQLSLLQKTIQQQADAIEFEKAGKQDTVESLEEEKEKRKVAEQNYQNEIEKRKVAEEKFEAEKKKRKAVEQDYESEIEKRKNAEQSCKKAAADMKALEQRSRDSAKEYTRQISSLEKDIAHLQITTEEQKVAIKNEKEKNKEISKKLEEKSSEETILLKCNEKLQANLTEMVAETRSLKVQLEEAENIKIQLSLDNQKISNDLDKFKEASISSKRKFQQSIEVDKRINLKASRMNYRHQGLNNDVFNKKFKN